VCGAAAVGVGREIQGMRNGLVGGLEGLL